MKSIEIKDDGYTYRYDFPMERTLGELNFVPDTILYNEPYVSPMEALRICMDLLTAIYGKEKMQEAYEEYEAEGCIWLSDRIKKKNEATE